MKFTLQHKDPSSQARAGELQTDHGVVKTPIFMPVGTAATVKGIFHRDVRDEARAQIILANTYHLYLRPGMDILERAGGVHRFSTWDGPMLTDSGGFQVFSLAGCRKLKEEGCHFQSHIDGSRHLFTPESVIDTERTIGADIMMAFDECPPGDSPRDYAAKSLALTERWLDRCFNRYRQTSPKYGHYQALFPIVQGHRFVTKDSPEVPANQSRLAAARFRQDRARQRTRTIRTGHCGRIVDLRRIVRSDPEYAAQPAASGAGFDNVRKSGAAGNGSIFRHTDRRRRPANRNIVR